MVFPRNLLHKKRLKKEKISIFLRVFNFFASCIFISKNTNKIHPTDEDFNSDTHSTVVSKKKIKFRDDDEIYSELINTEFTKVVTPTMEKLTPPAGSHKENHCSGEMYNKSKKICSTATQVCLHVGYKGGNILLQNEVSLSNNEELECIACDADDINHNKNDFEDVKRSSKHLNKDVLDNPLTKCIAFQMDTKKSNCITDKGNIIDDKVIVAKSRNCLIKEKPVLKESFAPHPTISLSSPKGSPSLRGRRYLEKAQEFQRKEKQEINDYLDDQGNIETLSEDEKMILEEVRGGEIPHSLIKFIRRFRPIFANNVMKKLECENASLEKEITEYANQRPAKNELEELDELLNDIQSSLNGH